MSVAAKNANEQIALDFFEALSTGELDRLRPFLTPDSVWEPKVKDIPGAGEYRGDAIIDDFLGPVRGLFAPGDPKVHVAAIFSDGDVVTVESTSTGRTADGKPYDNLYCWVFRMKDGKIARIHEYMDSPYVARLFAMETPA